MKRIWLEKDGTLQVLTDENLDDVKRVLVTRKGSIYGSLFYPDSEKRPKGKWISLDDFRGKYNDYGFKCSECDEHCDYEASFCPNCGAVMIEEEWRR